MIILERDTYSRVNVTDRLIDSIQGLISWITTLNELKLIFEGN